MNIPTMKNGGRHLIILMTLVTAFLGAGKAWADDWTNTSLAAGTYVLTTSGSGFKVNSGGTIYTGIGNITAAGTVTIEFKNTKTITLNGLIKADGKRINIKKTSGTVSPTIKRGSRNGAMFYALNGGSLYFTGVSSDDDKNRLIIDGGATYETAGDARTKCTATGSKGQIVRCDDAVLSMSHVMIMNGYSEDRGCAIYCYNEENAKKNATLTDVKIQGCFSTDGGPAMYLRGPDWHNVSCTRVEILYCCTTGSPGYTIRANGSTKSNLTLSACNIHHNKAIAGAGLGWNCAGDGANSKCIITGNTTIHDNEATSYGGGIVGETNLDIQSADIYNNTAPDGAGIYLKQWGASAGTVDATGFSVTLGSDVKIHNNTATGTGGGVYFHILNSEATGFKAKDSNGNIAAVAASFTLTVNGAEIYGNKANLGAGIAMYDPLAKRHYNSEIGKWSGIISRSVTVSSGSIHDNTTTGNNSKGAGIYIRKAQSSDAAYVTDYSGSTSGGGTLTFTASGGSICNNGVLNGTVTATYGGGIFVTHDFTTASYNSSCEVKVQSSASIYANQCTTQGGAIYFNNGSFTMTGGTIGGIEANANKVTGNNGKGGGFYITGSTASVSVSGGTISYNTANATGGLGGGFYVDQTGKSGTSITGSAKVTNNQATSGGGAYINEGTLTVNGSNVEIKSNTATAGNGGGIYANGGTVTLTAGSIANNTATGSGTTGLGGGIYSEGNLTIQGATIGGTATTAKNSAYDGAGVYVAGGTVSHTSGSVRFNEASYNGGGIYSTGGTVIIDGANALVGDNTATNGDGGGIYGKGAVTVTGATVSGNHADSGNGGGIYAEAGSNTITIESGSSITGNTAQHGAGLYAASGTVDVKTNSTITSNAASQNGGGIYANGGTVNVSATAATTEILKQNTAVNGGGIYANGGTVDFSNGIIKNNYASHWGGGLYIPATGKLTLKGTATITGNHVPAGMHGGGVYLAGVVEVGSASKASTDILKVEDNYADAAGATVTDDNRNNIYLPNPTVNSEHKDVITIFNTGINTTSSSVGFSVPRNFVPVIYCSDASYLAGLVDNDGILQGSYIFEDSHKYTAYYHNYAPYDANHIYLSSGTWVNHVTSQPATGFTESDGNVTVSTEEGLAWLISYVNGLNNVDGGAHDMAGKTVTLTADVNMGDYAWVPIGSILHADAFKGTFDGNGHTISNIYCMYLGDQVTGQNLGMFGAVNGNAVIKDVFLEDAEYTTLNQTTGTPFAGGLVETLGGSAKIYNCGVEAKLESLATGSVMGGLVGKMEGGEIHSAFAVAEMTGYTMGGLVGQITAGNLYNSFANPQFNYSGPYTDPEDPETDINLYVGGLVADNGTNGKVQNCYVRFSRTQTLTNALFGQLAGNNEGSITDCYTPATFGTDVPSAIVHTGSATSATYELITKAPYLYSHSNNLVGTTELYKKLNEWVSGQHDEHPEYAYWKRTTAGGYGTGGNINDDYPIHKMVGLSNAASPDGLFIEYKYSLDAMLDKYNDLEDGGTVWVYDSPLSAMTASGGTPSYEDVSVANAAKVKLYIDEDASLLQAADNTLTAYTGQTLRNYNDNDNRWHNVSSSLKQSGIGFDYYNDGHGQDADFNWDINPCNIALSADNDNAFFPSDLPWPATAKMDFYCFYEPEYHWLNLKRNTNSHYHMNANDVPIAYNGNGLDPNGGHANENETYMVPGKGYLVSIDKDQLIQNKGELNNGTVTLYSVTKTDYNAWAGLLGYNLLGNPYQSYLDFEVFKTTNSGLWAGTSEYNQTYATFDPEQNAYRQYFGGTSSGATVASQYIHPHQGFFIRMTKGNTNTNTTTVTYTNDMRTNATDRQSGFRGAVQPRHALVNFVVRDAQGKGDIAVLELNRNGDEGAEKIRMGDGTGHLSLGYDGKAYAILFRTEVGDYQPLWFEATEAGIFTLGWDIHNAVFESLTLVDNIAGTSTDMLSTDTYTFQGSPDHYASRFKVVVGDFVEVDPDAPTEPEPVEGSTFAFIVGDELVVDGEGTLQVFDVMGRQLSSTTLSGTRSTVGLPAMAAGVYVLRLTNGNGTKTQKIVIENW